MVVAVDIVLAGICAALYVGLKPDAAPKAVTAGAADSQTFKTYCSDYGYLCFDYPATWKLSEAKTDDEAISPETTRVTSPSGATVVTHRPNFGATNRTEANILSVMSVDNTKASDLKVVSMVDEYDGGWIARLPYSLETYVTNNLKTASGDTLVEGTTVTTADEPVFHTFTPRNNAKLTSFLYVKFDQANVRQDEAGLYANRQDALKALENSESRTARQILQSVRYR